MRDKSNHTLVPGVMIGDCGPKEGLDGIDNGWLKFNNLKLPYDSLLDKFSKIENGKFVNKVENENKRFGMTMGVFSSGRVGIINSANMNSIIALAISIRYSAIRH